MLRFSVSVPLIVLGISVLIIANSCERNPKEVQLEQYYSAGKLFYQSRCANCHGTDGKGIGKLYPPLAQSDYLLENPNRTVCIVKYGLNDTIVVNGITYHLPMPANESLSSLEIAQILTFVYTEWGSKPTLFEEEQVRQLLDTCKIQQKNVKN
jgi:mono/diheme cytochrome c family protein